MYKFRLFYANLCNLVEHKIISNTSLIRNFIKSTEIKDLAGLIPNIIQTLYSCKDSVKKIKESQKSVIKAIQQHHEMVTDDLDDCINNGLLWRYSSTFLSFVQDSILWRILEKAYGTRQAIDVNSFSR